MPPSPVLLADAIDVLSASSGLLHDVTVSQAIHFITTASRLLGDIQHHRPRTDQDNDDAPPCLSPQIAFVLSKLTEIDLKWIPTCWNAFKDVVWASSTTEDIAATNTEAFKLYGLAHEFYAMAPATVYHYNYSVQDRTRYYHSGVPDIIQVGAHHFIERSVINLFVNLQVAAWTSFTHCADIYNESIGPLSGYVDEIWSFKMALRTEHVRDAINTLALLEESEMDRTYLVVPHDGSQEDRLVEAMKASHERTVAYGQRDGNHACKKCVHAWEDKDGKRCREDNRSCYGWNHNWAPLLQPS
ncbi:hypothetical protein FRC00_011271 [Tulasnella sp. 408]|nr:hypothetical protein FRC00_011271 [Tulasnella sp. 408]